MPAPTLPDPPPIPAEDLLTFLFSATPDHPDKSLFISASNPDWSYTWGESLSIIKKLIAGLQAHPSFRPRSTVCVHSKNSPLFPILVLGIIGAGGVFTGTNPAYTRYELAHALRVTETRLVLCESEGETLGPMVKAMEEVEKLNTDRDLVVLDVLTNQTEGVVNKSKSWQSLISQGSRTWTPINHMDELANTTVALFLSSGTTGLPKAVPLTHHNLIAQHQFVYAPYTHLRSPSSPTCLPGYRPTKTTSGGVRILISIPLFHIGAGNLTFVTAVKENRTTIVMRRFQVQDFLDNFERFECNEMIAVPPMVHAIIAAAGARGSKQEKNVKTELRRCQYAVAGAAPLDGNAHTRLQELMGRDIPDSGGVRGSGGRLSQLWGMTELSCIVCFIPPAPRMIDKYMGTYEGSVGWTVKGMEIGSFDPSTLRPVPKGEEGELWVRGASVTRGYFGNTRETRKTNNDAFVEGSDGRGEWFRSGDLGRQDQDTGLWFIVGRVKELIKVRGFQVSPPEVEEVIRQMSGVADVAVVGLPSLRVGDGEVPAAFVVRAGGSSDQVTELAVKKWVEEKLSRYKWLEGGVRSVDAIPRNASGKILRRVLKETIPVQSISKAKDSKL